MIQLANGCRYSGVKVTPKNWKNTTSVKKSWSVWYRFYDDNFKKEYPKGKLVPCRDMNIFKTAEERRNEVKTLIKLIAEDLEERDYHPITGYIKETEVGLPDEDGYLVHPITPTVDALQLAYNNKEIVGKSQMKSAWKYAKMAIEELKFDKIPIKDIRRRHVKRVLEQIGKIKERPGTGKSSKKGEKQKEGKWTNRNYNFFRSHLMMLFDWLCEEEAIEMNPVDKHLKKKKHTRRQRLTLTDQERRKVNDYLRKFDYPFWRFMHIFFHSGGRETEMMRVTYEDVDLKRQMVKYLILKDNEPYEEYRPIKDIALNLWQQVMAEAQPGQYLFSRKFKPWRKPMDPNQISKRWARQVKKPLGIQADFYSLKHTNSTETSALVGTALAAKQNSHTEAVLRQVYDVQYADREVEILKKVNNHFAPAQA